jgi:hypothetical protein
VWIIASFRASGSILLPYLLLPTPVLPTWSDQLGRLCLDVGDDGWPLPCG